jgi:hypothetical protein
MDKMNGKSSLKSLFFLKWGSVIIREIAKYYIDVYNYLLLIASSVWTVSDLRQVGDVLRFPPPITLPATI